MNEQPNGPVDANQKNPQTQANPPQELGKTAIQNNPAEQVMQAAHLDAVAGSMGVAHRKMNLKIMLIVAAAFAALATALLVASFAATASLVDIVPTSTGNGYYRVLSDGTFEAYGDATYDAEYINKIPAAGTIVAATRSGNGFVATNSAGKVYALSGASYKGGFDGALNAPIVDIIASGAGYRLIGGDGGAFDYGTPSIGSITAVPDIGTIVAAASTPSGNGIYFVNKTGAVYAIGDASYKGSLIDHDGKGDNIDNNGGGEAAVIIADASGYLIYTNLGQIYNWSSLSCGNAGAQTAAVVSVATAGAKCWVATATTLVGEGGANVIAKANTVPTPEPEATVVNDPAPLAPPAESNYKGFNPTDSLVATASGNGYWRISTDGTYEAYGDAQYDTKYNDKIPLSSGKIVGAIASGDGFIAASNEGHVFAMLGTSYKGGTNDVNGDNNGKDALSLKGEISDIIPGDVANSYRLVAVDGGVFSFGASSNGGGALTYPTYIHDAIVAAESSQSGNGILFVDINGGVYALGDAKYSGSLIDHNGDGTGGDNSGGGVATDILQTGADSYIITTSNGQFYRFKKESCVLDNQSAISAIAASSDKCWVLAGSKVVATAGATTYDLREAPKKEATATPSQPVVLPAPIVVDKPTYEGYEANATIVPTASGNGLWRIFPDGKYETYGDAKEDSTYKTHVPVTNGDQVVGAIASGDGFVAVNNKGAVFAMVGGDYKGGANNINLQAQIVDIVPGPSNVGYRLIGADGGVFDYGTPAIDGLSLVSIPHQTIIAAATSQSGNGLWFLAKDGGVFALGDSAFQGRPEAFTGVVTDIASDHAGYVVVTSGGQFYRYGEQRCGEIANTISSIDSLAINGSKCWILTTSKVEADGGGKAFTLKAPETTTPSAPNSGSTGSSTVICTFPKILNDAKDGCMNWVDPSLTPVAGYVEVVVPDVPDLPPPTDSTTTQLNLQDQCAADGFTWNWGVEGNPGQCKNVAYMIAECATYGGTFNESQQECIDGDQPSANYSSAYTNANYSCVPYFPKKINDENAMGFFCEEQTKSRNPRLPTCSNTHVCVIGTTTIVEKTPHSFTENAFYIWTGNVSTILELAEEDKIANEQKRAATLLLIQELKNARQETTLELTNTVWWKNAKIDRLTAEITEINKQIGDAEVLLESLGTLLNIQTRAIAQRRF